MIKPLTSLRFFAALAVIIEHLGTDLNIGGPGVIFFFVLSGFIIAYTYANRIKQITKESLTKMYAIRIGRIFPLHLFVLALCIPFAFMNGDPPKLYVLLTNALLVQSWYPSHDDFFAFNSVAWTLSIEWFFYLSFPFVLIPLRNLGAFTTPAKCLAFSAVALAAILLVNGIFNHGGEFLNATWWAMKISPVNVLIFFVGSGIGMWRLCIGDQGKRVMWRDTGLELLAILSPVAAYKLFNTWGVETPLGIGYIGSYVPFFTFMVLVFSHTNGLISKALSNNVLVRLGEISFAIYMSHQVILNIVNTHIATVIGAGASLQVKILMFAVILLISELLYRFIENPARLAVKERMARKKVDNAGQMPQALQAK